MFLSNLAEIMIFKNKDKTQSVLIIEPGEEDQFLIEALSRLGFSVLGFNVIDPFGFFASF